MPEVGIAEDETPYGDERFLQGRIFAAFTSVLERLAIGAPLVLVIEDLHWADPSSRGLLAHLARALIRGRILIIASVRDEDLAGLDPISTEIAELDRDADVSRIRIDPLDAIETAELVRALGYARLADTEIEHVYVRSGGSPFYLEELLSGAEPWPATAVPPTIREIVLARMHALRPAARALLQAASRVSGQPSRTRR